VGGSAVWKADDAVAFDAVAGNAVACGDDSGDDDIPRTAHSRRSRRNRKWLEHRLLSLQIRGSK